MLEKFLVPEVVFGQEVLKKLAMTVKRLAGKRVFLVSDYGVEQAGWTKKAENYLHEAGIFYTTYTEVTSNPRDYEVEKALALYRQENCDIIVCLGGGSPMDLAKGVAVLAANGGKISDYEGMDKASLPLPPMIMIPSTSGTGSEVSQFAIIKDSVSGKKMSLVGKNLIPNIALVDPLLTSTLPQYWRACCGMDALTHALEAFVSVAASDFTNIYALKAIELIGKAIDRHVQDNQDIKSLNIMAKASLFAGIAFSNASLGLVHAMAHQVGGMLDLPHGEVNAILLPYVMEYNLPLVTEKYAQVALLWGEKEKNNLDLAKAAIQKVRQWGRDFGISNNLSNYPITEKHLEFLTLNTLKDPCIYTNPRQVCQEDVYQIYLQVWRQKKPILSQPKKISFEKIVEKMVGVSSSKITYYAQLKEQVSVLEKTLQAKKTAEETICKLNEELEARVLERTAQLEAANKELEAFSYSVSHDLRAPLRAIDGFSLILLEDYLDKLDGEAERYLRIIRHNTSKMGQLIDDLLAFSRLSRKTINVTKINMNELIEEVYKELVYLEEKREICFQVEKLPLVQGDLALLRQVFVNLLSNALKFTRLEKNPRIIVGCKQKGQKNIYYIQDNGVGFDMQYAGKLFGVFQRLHGEEEFEGTGVGLAIVQRVIQRHGGEIWAQAQEQVGATFFFTLSN